MRLWSIQPESLYMKLKEEKVLYCDPAQSELISEYSFGPAYVWLAGQMVLRVGRPPVGVKYPFWAWHTMEWKHRKPDLRRTEFRSYSENQVCIELEVPDKDVLLSNEDMWHLVLNDGYYGDYSNEREYEAEDNWYNSLLPAEQLRIKQKSWEKIFDVSPPWENEWESHGKYIQATFWELRLDQVIEVRHFKGRKKY
ncbi:DUF3841 domain-containing protein [Desulforamulus ruminis]|uniref:DUF3841 domain-containing protein n=1 Tax=Desulforamulus ruminis (strain ATCC 23193 / DSM 2154 / NCIMB 8452 / DL) TaxID=696281 RepID=F6DMG7_DESRL|nr:DUF3841 domain-containing protein [Desulforamulus ruminis]AEG61728.1 hypothetical protein Desru_3525 [Desulforamulus ruminis DSM 2154]